MLPPPDIGHLYECIAALTSNIIPTETIMADNAAFKHPRILRRRYATVKDIQESKKPTIGNGNAKKSSDRAKFATLDIPVAINNISPNKAPTIAAIRPKNPKAFSSVFINGTHQNRSPGYSAISTAFKWSRQ
jgi:hypothetical protein